MTLNCFPYRVQDGFGYMQGLLQSQFQYKEAANLKSNHAEKCHNYALLSQVDAELSRNEKCGSMNMSNSSNGQHPLYQSSSLMVLLEYKETTRWQSTLSQKRMYITYYTSRTCSTKLLVETLSQNLTWQPHISNWSLQDSQKTWPSSTLQNGCSDWLLPTGVSAAAAIFQSSMDYLLEGIFKGGSLTGWHPNHRCHWGVTHSSL